MASNVLQYIYRMACTSVFERWEKSMERDAPLYGSIHTDVDDELTITMATSETVHVGH